MTFSGPLCSELSTIACSQDTEDMQTGKATINLLGRKSFGFNSVILFSVSSVLSEVIQREILPSCAHKNLC